MSLVLYIWSKWIYKFNKCKKYYCEEYDEVQDKWKNMIVKI